MRELVADVWELFAPTSELTGEVTDVFSSVKELPGRPWEVFGSIRELITQVREVVAKIMELIRLQLCGHKSSLAEPISSLAGYIIPLQTKKVHLQSQSVPLRT